MKTLLFTTLVLAQQLPAGPAMENPATHATVGGPLMGYVLDQSTGDVRPLCGIPGASLLGGAFDAGVKLSTAVTSPDGLFLLGIAAEDSRPALLVASGGAVSARPLADASPGVDRIALSPTGVAAALFSSSGNWIEVLAGLPDTPVLLRRIDVSGLAFSPRILAVSDDGQLVLAASGQAAPVWLGGDGQAHELALPAPSAVAFRAQSHDALLAGSADDRSWLVSGIAGETQYRPMPAYGTAAGAVAVEFSSDGRRFYIAGSDGSIAQFDFQGGTPDRTSCACTPTGLHRLGGDSVFLLNDAGAGPLYLLDGSRAKPRVLFVPPDGGDQ